VVSRLLVKKRVDPAGVAAQRRMLGELPAREAAELPVRRRRTKQTAAAAATSFRGMLEAGRKP
jgi:hypothetical protein